MSTHSHHLYPSWPAQDSATNWRYLCTNVECQPSSFGLIQSHTILTAGGYTPSWSAWCLTCSHQQTVSILWKHTHFLCVLLLILFTHLTGCDTLCGYGAFRSYLVEFTGFGTDHNEWISVKRKRLKQDLSSDAFDKLVSEFTAWQASIQQARVVSKKKKGKG